MKGRLLGAAKSAITRSHCRVGKIAKKYSSKVKKNRVISESPAAGKRLSANAKVNLVVSRGRKAKH